MPPNEKEDPHINIDTNPCPTVGSGSPTNTAVDHLFDDEHGVGAVDLASTTSSHSNTLTLVVSSTSISTASPSPAVLSQETNPTKQTPQTSTASPPPLSPPAIIAIILAFLLILTLPTICFVKCLLRSRQKASLQRGGSAIRLERWQEGRRSDEEGTEGIKKMDRGGRDNDKEREERKVLERKEMRARDSEKALPPPPGF